MKESERKRQRETTADGFLCHWLGIDTLSGQVCAFLRD